MGNTCSGIQAGISAPWLHYCAYKESKLEAPAAPPCTSEDAEQHRSQHEARTQEVQALVPATILSAQHRLSFHSLLHCPEDLCMHWGFNITPTAACSPWSAAPKHQNSTEGLSAEPFAGPLTFGQQPPAPLYSHWTRSSQQPRLPEMSSGSQPPVPRRAAHPYGSLHATQEAFPADLSPLGRWAGAGPAQPFFQGLPFLSWKLQRLHLGDTIPAGN